MRFQRKGINKPRGFILPVVVILAVALTTVGVTAFRTVSNSSVQLNNSYYNQLAREAAQAGARAAQACITKSATTTWPAPLQPNTDCQGTVGSGITYVTKSANWESSYSVATPSGSPLVYTSTGTLKIKTAAGATVQTFTKTLKFKQVTTSTTIPAKTVSMVSSGGSGFASTCGVGFDTSLNLSQGYCWGSKYGGKLGNADGNSSLTWNNLVGAELYPVRIAATGASPMSGKNVTKISTGHLHGCAIAEGKVYCWGQKDAGRLGEGTTGIGFMYSNIPIAVNTAGALNGKTVTDVSSGYHHTCVVAYQTNPTDAKPYCWGYATNGRLGNGATSGVYATPVLANSAVLTGKTVTSVTAGYAHTCALAYTTALGPVDSKPYCWGHNYSGQLGNGNTTQQATPVAVVTTGVLLGKTVSSISAGINWEEQSTSDDDPVARRNQTCVTAYTTALGPIDSKAYCWGNGNRGQTGNGAASSSNTSTTPIAVATDAASALSGKTVTRIDSGRDSTCAVAYTTALGVNDSKAYCWGYQLYGQLGNGLTAGANISKPIAVNATGVLAGKRVFDISTGERHSCVAAAPVASPANIHAYCWGLATYGRLGNGMGCECVDFSPDTSPLPAAVNDISQLSALSATTTTGTSAFIYY